MRHVPPLNPDSKTPYRSKPCRTSADHLFSATANSKHKRFIKLADVFKSPMAGSAIVAAIFFIVLMSLVPASAMADQVTLVWDANQTTPDGYCVFQRLEGQSYNYSNPAWPKDGLNHTETTCAIDNLSEGNTYHFVVRAYVGQEYSGNSNEISFTANVTASQTYDTVDVTDDSGTQTDASNHPPAAEAGTNQIVSEGELVNLNGSHSNDADGDTLTYSWTQTYGAKVVLNDADTAQCSFIAPDLTTQSVTLVFELKVTDSNELSSSDTVLVQVNPALQTLDNDNDGISDDMDTDDDNDGMPDVWETQHNLDPYTDDAGNDPDNDGLTSLEEYLAGSDPNANATNLPPDKPVLTSPLNAATGVNTTLSLETSTFSDPDRGDSHAMTQWRIIFSGTHQVALDRTTKNNHLTNFKVPRLVLEPATRYVVQVRFYDNHDEPSSWSPSVYFTTGNDVNDLNQNKIPDIQELAAETDMNGDTIPDATQGTFIKSVSTFDDAYAMAVSIDDTTSDASVDAVASVDPCALQETTVSLTQAPYGLLSYKIFTQQPGNSVNVTIYLSNGIDTNVYQWVRYDDAEGILACDASTSIDESEMVVYRHLVDGGDEDADGVANGVIVDISGPSSILNSGNSSLAISNNDSAASSGSGGGGCFIESLF